VHAILILCAAFVPLAAVILVGLHAARATRLWPAALLIMTAPLEVYRSSSGAGVNASLFRIALAIALGALALDFARGRKPLPRSLAVPFAVYALLVLWQLISLGLVTANHSLAYRFLGQYVAGLVAAFIVTQYVQRDDLPIVVGLCAAAAILPLSAAAFRVFSVNAGGSGNLPGLSELPVNLIIEGSRQGGSSLINGTQRLNATFADPNQFSFYIATAFLVAMGAVCALSTRRAANRDRALLCYALLAAAAAVAVVGTYSRSGWVLAAAGSGILAALLGRSFWTRRRVIATALSVAVGIGIASPLIIARLRTSEAGNVKSTQVHEHTMQLALKLLEHHPLVGVGLGGYGHYADQPPLISSAVSTFLTVGAELGLIGVTLLVSAIAVTALAALRTLGASELPARAYLAGLLAAYVALAGANAIGEVWMNDFQWALFGVLLAVTAQRQVAFSAVRAPRPARTPKPPRAAKPTKPPKPPKPPKLPKPPKPPRQPRWGRQPVPVRPNIAVVRREEREARQRSEEGTRT
jgi:O-Antigen ligase